YTIEFDTKPFGMNWTPTEDGKNLWVSAIASKSQAAIKGVVPGSMLIALNGVDIKDMGAQTIFDKSASCGLPLRITFRRPAGIDVPNNKDECNPEVVNKCVALLKDPDNWELNDKQKEDICKKQGANAAEIAAAVFLANYIIENSNRQPDIHETENAHSGTVMGYPGPSNSDFPSQPNTTYSTHSDLDDAKSTDPSDLPDVPNSKSSYVFCRRFFVLFFIFVIGLFLQMVLMEMMWMIWKQDLQN
ncbi:hypothetical protein RFI_11197, partial [Reticulomyxa filosa]